MQKQYAYFSGAILDGAKLRPQAFNESYPAQFEARRTCAIASGIEAIAGFQAIDDCMAADVVFASFPYMNNIYQGCPVGDECGDYFSLYGTAVHLNDDHHWERERIAAWLYAEEEKLGFITLSEETEAHKPEMTSEFETVKTTA